MGDARHQRVDVAVGPVELRDLARHPVVGSRPLRSPQVPEASAHSSRVWVSVSTLRKSGIWQTSQSSRTAAGVASPAPRSRHRAPAAQREMVVGVAHLHQARQRRPLLEAVEQQAATTAKSSSVLRHKPAAAARSCGSRPPRPISASSGARARRWCRRCRRACAGPARPAICAISAGRSRRGRAAVELRSPAKATWSTSMLRPMPMASVATR